MNIDRKRDLIVFALVFILTFLLGRNTIYQAGRNRIASKRAEIKEEEKKNEILKTIGILHKRFEVLQERSFSTTEITYFLDKVSAAAKKSGIKIKNFDPLPAVDRQLYIETPLNIALQCEYDQLGELIALMENSQEFIWVKELSIKKPTVIDPNDKKTPEVNLAISGLYLKK